MPRVSEAHNGSGSRVPRPTASGITRGERACEECRRMKVRCLRGEANECGRCQHMGMPCVITNRTSRRVNKVKDTDQATRSSDSAVQESDALTLPGSDHKTVSPQHSINQLSDISPSRPPASQTPAVNTYTLLDDLDTQSGRWGNTLEDLGNGQPWASSGVRGPEIPRHTTVHHDTSLGRQQPDSNPCRSPPADDLLATEHINAPFERLRYLTDSRLASREATPDGTQMVMDMSSNPHFGTSLADMSCGKHNGLVSILLSAMSPTGWRPRPDLVRLGIIQKDRGQQLIHSFFTCNSDFILVHDVSHDTWEHLSTGPPISLSAILAVSAASQDGLGVESEIQKNATIVTRALILSTVFGRRQTTADVQAILTMGVYHKNCSILIGLAKSLAITLGIDKAFSRLLSDGIHRDRSSKESEDDRERVSQARIWFGLFAHDVQHSFANGRPPAMPTDRSFADCRKFLDHPLSIPPDVRLVALVELLLLRTPLHIDIQSGIAQSALVSMLLKFKMDLGAWYEHYDSLMAERLHLSPTSYYRESLRTQREYASLFANSLLLRGFSEASNLRILSDEAYILAMSAVRSAQTCLDVVIRGLSYPQMLKYSTPHARMCVTFAASFLLRTSKLFPDRLDPTPVTSDVETLASMLEVAGSKQLAKALRSILLRASRSTTTAGAKTVNQTSQSILGSGSTRPDDLPPGSSSFPGDFADSGESSWHALFGFPPDSAYNNVSAATLEFQLQDFWASSMGDGFPTGGSSQGPMGSLHDSADPTNDFNDLLSNLQGFGQS